MDPQRPTAEQTVIDRCLLVERTGLTAPCLVAGRRDDMPRFATCARFARLLIAVSPHARVEMPGDDGPYTVTMPIGQTSLVLGGSWNWPRPCPPTDYLHIAHVTDGMLIKAWTMGPRGAIADRGALACRTGTFAVLTALWSAILKLATENPGAVGLATVARALLQEHRRILEQPAEPSSGPPLLFVELLDHLRSSLGEEQDRKRLGRRFGIHPNHLSRLFRRHAGVGFSAWLTAERLALAGELLRQTDLPVAEVARRCGFRDQAYFSRVFHRQEGLTPTRWRHS